MRHIKLVRIPRHLLHVQLDDLAQLGVAAQAGDALRALLADLPLVPDAKLSAALIGPDSVTLPCLAVLARHVGQGLRDHNLSIAGDRQRLHTERGKLIFLDAAALEEMLLGGDERALREAVLLVHGQRPAVLSLLAKREAANLASFVTSTTSVPALVHWRQVRLNG